MHRPGMEKSKSVSCPLADELFDCRQGPYKSVVPLELTEHRYHTYRNMVWGSLSDPDTESALLLAFGEYLKRLREATPSPDGVKPILYWRFRIGDHIQLEEDPHGRNLRRVKLYTRLVVPDCTLHCCYHCLITDGEDHYPWCPNLGSLRKS